MDFVGAVIALPKPIEAPVGTVGLGVPGQPTAQVISKLQSALMFNDPEDVMRARTLPSLPSIKSAVTNVCLISDMTQESGTTRRGI